ncbi:MAG: hypothetical protein CMJ78_17585 [Planctomycetaceae bacterium]|nr:hypothetical protein [Planctomycetaceae bacterium]
MVSAVLLAFPAAIEKRRGSDFSFHWGALAVIFTILSVDEIVGFHEYPIELLRDSLGVGSLLYYAWVLPGIVVVGILGLAFLRFVLHLPKLTRNQVIISGAMFVFGAIGIEMLSGVQADQFGEETFAYSVIITLEESLEMIGIAVFTLAVYTHIAKSDDCLNVLIPAPR